MARWIERPLILVRFNNFQEVTPADPDYCLKSLDRLSFDGVTCAGVCQYVPGLEPQPWRMVPESLSTFPFIQF